MVTAIQAPARCAAPASCGRHGLEGMEGADRNPQRFQCGRGGESGEMDCRGSRPRFQGLGNLGDGVVAHRDEKQVGLRERFIPGEGLGVKESGGVFGFGGVTPENTDDAMPGALRRQRESKPRPDRGRRERDPCVFQSCLGYQTREGV